MQPARRAPFHGTGKLDPHLIGVVCGVISAVAYTACNICLRQVAEHGDAVWVSCVKAMPVAATAGLMLCRQARDGVALWPSRRLFVGVVLTAVFMQLAGNVGFQVALGHIGLAVTVPLSFGTILVGAAVLARLWLGEPINRRTAAAMAVVLAAILVLSLAAQRDSGASRAAGLGNLMFGVAAGCVAGFAYGSSSVVVRHAVTSGMTLSATLAVMSSTGVVCLGLASLISAGPAAMLGSAPLDLAVMLTAGAFNALAFYTLAKSLQLMSVVHANLLNASQVAMAALAGVVLFGEALSAALIVGVILTSIGLLLIKGSRKHANAAASEHDASGDARLALSSTTSE